MSVSALQLLVQKPAQTESRSEKHRIAINCEVNPPVTVGCPHKGPVLRKVFPYHGMAWYNLYKFVVSKGWAYILSQYLVYFFYSPYMIYWNSGFSDCEQTINIQLYLPRSYINDINCSSRAWDCSTKTRNGRAYINLFCVTRSVIGIFFYHDLFTSSFPMHCKFA